MSRAIKRYRCAICGSLGAINFVAFYKGEKVHQHCKDKLDCPDGTEGDKEPLPDEEDDEE